MAIIKKKLTYSNYLQSGYWQKLKVDIIEFRGAQCEKCGEWFDDMENELNIHHISYGRWYAEKWENLVILCKGCHKWEHNENNIEPIKDYNQFIDPV